MTKFSPSLLAADFSKLESEIKRVDDAGAEMLHLDVMDGVFVPNISFGFPVIKSIRKCTDMIFDVHLMITDPGRYIDVVADAGADIITFHYESCEDRLAVIKKIKAAGKKVCISVKPKTSAEVLAEYIPYLDMILIMTVEPGFGGQKFIMETVENIRIAKRLADAADHPIDIEVDGGINPETARICADAGANVYVAGNAVFRAEDCREVMDVIRKATEK